MKITWLMFLVIQNLMLMLKSLMKITQTNRGSPDFMGIHESQIGRNLGIFFEGYEKQIQEHGVYAVISTRLCMLMKKQEAQQEMKGR